MPPLKPLSSELLSNKAPKRMRLLEPDGNANDGVPVVNVLVSPLIQTKLDPDLDIENTTWVQVSWEKSIIFQ
jgi:hypothetical protein